MFDPNVGSSLIMDIGYGVVSFSVFGLGVTVDDLMEMAASLVPEELTDAEKGRILKQSLMRWERASAPYTCRANCPTAMR